MQKIIMTLVQFIERFRVSFEINFKANSIR
jgi:hypothetical protein